MLRRPGPPLRLALVCAVALAVTGVLAYLVPVAHETDTATLQGFVGLNGPRLTPLLDAVAHLADPVPYAIAGLALAAIAAARGRARVAVAVLALLVLTGATTELLKHVLAAPRLDEWLASNQISAASWPSGHATASMTLALCGVMVAPARWRPTVAALGGAFAIGVSYAILALAWHFPSDVLGGFLVAATWTLLAIAALAALERRRPARVRTEPPPRATDAAPALALAAAATGVAIGLAVQRPAELADYAAAHTAFVAVAAGIAALAVALAGMLVATMRASR